MKNIVYGVILGNYAIFATLCSFRLLFRRRTLPGLPWGAGSDLRLASFGRGSGAAVAVSPQIRRLATDMLFKRRNSDAGRGHSPDDHLPWRRSNSSGPGVVLRKR